MRLVCPKCEAKYEVPDDAIPEGGRDVQCANCNHAWFQMRPVAAEPALVLTPEGEVPPVAKAAPVAQVPEPEPEPEPEIEPEPEVEPEIPPDDLPEDLPEDVPEDVPEELPGATPVEIPVGIPVDLPENAPEELPEDESGAAPESGIEAAPEPEPEIEPEPEPEPGIGAATAYKVDDSVLAILREEAEREVKARRAETNISEAPPALGAAVTAAAAATPVVEETRSSARRDLLPDVEEINSSLRPSEHEPEDRPDDSPPPETRGGFRSGFLMVMAVAMIGSAVYLAAPALSRLVPSLAEPLDSYVALINGLRLQLDGVMRQATVALNGG